MDTACLVPLPDAVIGSLPELRELRELRLVTEERAEDGLEEPLEPGNVSLFLRDSQLCSQRKGPKGS